MSVESSSKGKSPASSNWLALQKQLNAQKKPSTNAKSQEASHEGRKKKRQKLDDSPQGSTKNQFSKLSITSDGPLCLGSFLSSPSVQPSTTHGGSKHGESVAALQQMTLGHLEYTDSQKLPGKYLALDCEMVGLGINGEASSLARVTLVNFRGAVILDEFVRQKERVVDYRTQWSGIRESDMVHAKRYQEVQKRVSDLLKNKILVGHAVHNDLKALRLTHPPHQTRDTQIYAHKFDLCKTRLIALRNLVKDQIGLTIQGGEHSSITDARATMAVYRLHKKEWEIGSQPLPKPSTSMTFATSPTIPDKEKEQEATADLEPASDVESTGKCPQPPEISLLEALGLESLLKDGSNLEYPGGSRKCVRSGRHIRKKADGHQVGMVEATACGGPPSGGSKGSITVGMKR